MIRTIVIAAGGTGGHISPGIALAETLIEKKDSFQYEKLIIHSLLRNKDNPDLKESPCPVIWHNMPQPYKNFILFPFLLLYTLITTFIKFSRLKVDCVIAMGGYSCIPAILYAILFKKKIFLCEQNRAIGKVTRIFMRRANKVCFSFPPMNIPNNIKTEIKVCGNPLRKKIMPDQKSKANRAIPTNKKEKLNVLVMGGSQGARQINNMVINSMNNVEISKNFNFRLLTGTSLYEEAKAMSPKPVDIISYSQDMKTHYEWAHLVIARAGAGVISECAVYLLPMILIPYPYAADNHQYENALYFNMESDTKVLNQRDENNSDLIDYLLNIQKDREKIVTLSSKLSKLARENASLDTVNFFFGSEAK